MSWQRYKKSTALRRRDMLRGLSLGAGGLFLLPFIDRLEAQAAGQAGRKKLVIVVEGNGYYGFGDWKKLTMGSPQVTSLGPLSSALPQAKALAPWSDRVLAINGLANKQGKGLMAGHYSCWYPLTCMPYVGSDGPGGPSVDAVLAEAVGSECVFPAVRLGAGGKVGEQVGLVATTSASGAGAPIAAQHDPREAWLELFGVSSDDPEDRAAFEEKTLLLDYIHEDIQRLEPRLASEEKWKLERYLESVETFQVRQQKLAERAEQLSMCAPATPLPLTGLARDVGTVFEQQVNLAAGALICGLTDIVVLSVGAGPMAHSQFASWGFGGRHAMGHGTGGTESRPAGGPGLVQNHDEIAQRIADGLIAPLEATPDGDGSMFDNTAIVFVNENGEQHHAHYDNFPVVICGDLGGALDTGGRRIDYPNHEQPGARGLAQLWNTIFAAMGVPIDDFAAGGRAPNQGPLDEVLA